MADVRFTISLGKQAEKDLHVVAVALDITKAAAFRKALILLKHAVNADKVILKKAGQDQFVLLK